MREVLPSGALDASVAVPGSKSLSNRGLAIGALARGETRLRGALFSEDTLCFARALNSLGLEVAGDAERAEFTIRGGEGRLPRGEVRLDVGASGTALRFLTALATLTSGEVRIDGTEGLRRRPVEPLCAALRSLGADVRAGPSGGAPVRVRRAEVRGGPVEVPANLSSQFASALLILGACLPGGLRLHLTGSIVSAPFVDLTLRIMGSFGARAFRRGERWIGVEEGGYEGRVMEIEGDATAASYFFAAAVVTGGRVRVTNLDLEGGQGDLLILKILERMGAEVEATGNGVAVSGRVTRAVAVDLRDAPDLVPTVAALGMIAPGVTRIVGVPHLRVKESDRIESTLAAVRALGGAARRIEDGIEVTGGTIRGGTVDPAMDHRIAMAFAVLGLGCEGVRIRDPECVSKSYPGFFEALCTLRS